MPWPIHDNISLTEDRTLQVVLVLTHTFNAPFKQKEDLTSCSILPREHRHTLNAHRLKLVEEVTVEAHFSVRQKLDLLNRGLVEELINLCFQMCGQYVKELVQLMLLAQRYQIGVPREDIRASIILTVQRRTRYAW